MARPLEATRVLEVGGGLAGAAATKVFGDYGANVTKVEPLAGGTMRRLGPFPSDVPHIDRGAYHLALDTGKRSAAVDTATPSGREVVRRLAAGAQLVVVDQPAAEARQLLDALSREGASTVTITPHGLSGPYAERVENDASAFAWTTRMWLHGVEGRPPLRYAPFVPTMQVGLTAATAGMAVLWAIGQGGERRDVEISSVEALAGNVDSFFLSWSFTGGDLPRVPASSRGGYPGGSYECADGWVLLTAAMEPFFSRLCAAIGHPELATDPRFTLAEREQHEEEFMAYLRPWLLARTREQATADLQAFGVMCAPHLEIPEVLADPQAVARGSFMSFEQPGVGEVTIAGPPFRVPGDEGGPSPAPALGQHTAEVLTEAGFSAEEQLTLFRAGVTG